MYKIFKVSVNHSNFMPFSHICDYTYWETFETDDYLQDLKTMQENIVSEGNYFAEEPLIDDGYIERLFSNLVCVGAVENGSELVVGINFSMTDEHEQFVESADEDFYTKHLIVVRCK